MSTGSITDALSRITAIEQQLQQVSSGSMLDSQLGISSDSSSGSSTAATQTADTGSTDFANALAQAQNPDSTSATDPASETDSAAVASTVPSDEGSSFGSLTGSALASASPTASAMSLLSGGVAPSAGATLPASAGAAALTSSQQQFASTLSADTGLNPSVVTAWLLSEESGGAAQTRQSAGNNDWLNVGYTDSATLGAQDPIWSDPVTAANATAQWLQGQNSVAGYGTASAGVQGILQSVGQTPAAQIQAIQNSGWASGGYPGMAGLYQQITG
jgi:hypothetical protein